MLDILNLTTIILAIMSGFVESHCAEYGVGLIRLMGRDAGYLKITELELKY